MKKAIAVILCAAILAAVFAGCGEKTEEVSAELNESGFRRTMLYYKSDDGYVVPVMKKIPWEEGIGKAALRQLVSSDDNDRSAAGMGLKTVLPRDAEFTLRIDDDGTARVNLSGIKEDMEEKDERAMVAAIVNTLCEFPAIDRVKLTLVGRKGHKIAGGLDISAPIEAMKLNVEEGEVQVSGNAKPVTLYFPNLSAGLNIPVTRYLEAVPSFAIAVNELVKGPEDPRLLSCFPEGTELISAYISGGIATVDFTEEFRAVEDTDGMLEAARDTICLCAGDFEQVHGVDILIDGKEYSGHTDASAPVYANEFR